jgi:hypothetical protein
MRSAIHIPPRLHWLRVAQVLYHAAVAKQERCSRLCTALYMADSKSRFPFLRSSYATLFPQNSVLTGVVIFMVVTKQTWLHLIAKRAS